MDRYVFLPLPIRCTKFAVDISNQIKKADWHLAMNVTLVEDKWPLSLRLAKHNKYPTINHFSGCISKKN